MNELPSFVQTIISHVNRMTGLAPNKIWKRDVPKLISLPAEQSRKLVLKPRYKIGNRVRIGIEDLPFKKGYRQSFSDEVFRVTNIATFNSPTFSLADKNGENFQGKFSTRTDKNSLNMDEFDIYLESTGSMQTYQNNKMACFLNVLAEALQLDGD